MDQSYLLTYMFIENDRSYSTFAWFESEEEMVDFINSHSKVKIIEAMKIHSAEEIKID